MLVGGFKLSSWNGFKCLSLVDNSYIALNPKNETSKRLREWFDTNYLYCDFQNNLSNDLKLDILKISDFTNLNDNNIFNCDAEFVKLEGEVVKIRSKKYEICTTKDCSMKKAKQVSKTDFKCQTCGKIFSNPKFQEILEV